MSCRNVIVFGAPHIDRSVVLQSAGVNDAAPFPGGVFEARKHTAVISRQSYTFYDIGGLSDRDDEVNPRTALGSLHKFALNLHGPINLLVYVVRGEPSEKNYRLFYEQVCQADVPILLFQQNPHSGPIVSQFKFECQLNIARREEVMAVIHRKCKKNGKPIPPEVLFMRTAIASWKLLEKTAGWSLSECRDALKETLMEEGCFSYEAAETTCGGVTDLIRRKYFHNIIVFGSAGVGKTSVINMLTDKCHVPVKASSAGVSTSESKRYMVELGGQGFYIFHDTIGLNDPTSSSFTPRDLFRLLTTVQGGVSLLIYVHRGKITLQDIENYKQFNAMCEGVPIALVVTGLEEVVDRDHWWEENKLLFKKAKMQTDHVACITATKGIFSGGAHVYQGQYEESKERLKNMLLAAPIHNAWKVKSSGRTFGSNALLVDSFVRNPEMSKADAKSLAKDLAELLKC